MSVFENSSLIVVAKPANVLTTPAREVMDSRPCLGRDLQKLLGQQIYPVHRLDYEVSGLVLFAKTPLAHRVAQKWFEDALVVKTYRARSVPQPEYTGNDEWQSWRSLLVRGKRRTFEAAHGKESLTLARVKPNQNWELRPVTGRPHQLRFEMVKHGFPIEGDVLYGAPKREAAGIALMAVALDFRAIEDRLGLPPTVEFSGEF